MMPEQPVQRRAPAPPVPPPAEHKRTPGVEIKRG